MDTIVRTKDLRKIYGDKVAVQGFTSVIDRGTCLGLIGHNGAGKTSILSMLCGLTLPTSGSVEVFGQSMAHRPSKVLKRMNFMSGYLDLPNGLSVQDMLVFFGRLYTLANPREHAERILDALGSGELRNRRPSTLSAGERARVQLAKAMINSPELLLLDEPTSALDPASAADVRMLLANAKRDRGLTMILASHNMKDVQELCDVVLFIHQGRILAQGTPAQLREQYQSSDLDEAYIKLAEVSRQS